ncbi:N-acetyl-gamma-glutamyl-phosphate reductase [Actinomyces bovis]|uniref:N-acetyl-gamma-glutamyl-phosphate reductase n=1 Tax=Actinomyces bovis TaxID=1658 RepID=A0ABY1VPC1_9ACTO|nr:N-acetyl-gamma-glutamyl-phosphate reductase [Actinomyces bovis]SPT53969.1 N-acetyl-gamma-glutamyl-phosphate reductase [Actinomyces bovis]VEG53508.1 N-acetyl-gamma-glutamyl-phosphate reductase [Actinomyces israelii]
MKLQAAVAGATGYAGGEVLRLLSAQPGLEIGAVTAGASAGTRLGEHHPQLLSLSDRLVEPSDVKHLLDHDVVVLALPHGASSAVTAALEQAGAASGHTPLLIDCGADHRLTSQAAWDQFYGTEYVDAWTYGMPELLHAGESSAAAQRAELAATGHIAVPGCNVTAVTLATQPGVAAGLIDTSALTAVLADGYSGAGKALKPHLTAAEALGSAQPYAVGGSHRHIPEIIQNLEVAGAAPGTTRLSFTPVLVPMSRGILATVTAPATPTLRQSPDPDAVLRQTWAQAYGEPGTSAGEALIHLLPQGTWPVTGTVAGSGLATVQVAYDAAAGVVTMICAIDNLGKGTASAALQSLNLALSMQETTGVIMEGVAP